MSNLSKWGGNINLTPHEKDVKKQQQQAQQQQPQQPHSATTTPSPHNPNFELPRGVMDITDLQQLKKNAEQQGKKVKLLHPWFPMAALSSVVLGAWLYYAWGNVPFEGSKEFKNIHQHTIKTQNKWNKTIDGIMFGEVREQRERQDESKKEKD